MDDTETKTGPSAATSTAETSSKPLYVHVLETYPEVPNLFDYSVSVPLQASLQQKIADFVEMKKRSIHLNERLYVNHEFRNPNIYSKLMEYVGLNEISSNDERWRALSASFPPEAFYQHQGDMQKRAYENKSKPAPIFVPPSGSSQSAHNKRM